MVRYMSQRVYIWSQDQIYVLYQFSENAAVSWWQSRLVNINEGMPLDFISGYKRNQNVKEMMHMRVYDFKKAHAWITGTERSVYKNLLRRVQQYLIAKWQCSWVYYRRGKILRKVIQTTAVLSAWFQ